MLMSWLYAPIGFLLALNRTAIATDLQFLRRAIEHGEVAKRLSSDLPDGESNFARARSYDLARPIRASAS